VVGAALIWREDRDQWRALVNTVMKRSEILELLSDWQRLKMLPFKVTEGMYQEYLCTIVL
jgi:hypothetical protein